MYKEDLRNNQIELIIKCKNPYKGCYRIKVEEGKSCIYAEWLSLSGFANVSYLCHNRMVHCDMVDNYALRGD